MISIFRLYSVIMLNTDLLVHIVKELLGMIVLAMFIKLLELNQSDTMANPSLANWLTG